MQFRERRVVADLADTLFAEGDSLLPEELREHYEEALREDLVEFGSDRKFWKELVVSRDASFGPRVGRVVIDYVSGMTDNYAERLHSRVLGTSPTSISDLI